MNRWVGIVALREPPTMTPVHRIALAIEAASRRCSYVFDGRDVPYARLRSEIRGVARRYAFLRDWDRWTTCSDAVRWFHDGAVSPPDLPGWLADDLRPRLQIRKPSHGAVAPPRYSSETAVRRPQPSLPQQQQKLFRPAVNKRPPRVLRSTDAAWRPLLQLPDECVSAPLHDALSEYLRRHGVDPATNRDLASWLAFSCFHASYFYEQHARFPGVNDTVLHLLGKFGAKAVDLMIADDFTARITPEQVGIQSKGVADLRPVIARELGMWMVGLQAVRLGRGEAQGNAPSVSQTVAFQMLGVLVLHDHYEVAHAVLRAACPSLQKPPTVDISPIDRLPKHFPGSQWLWDYAHDGPDHAIEFTCELSDGQGRKAKGKGRSKKEARATTAFNFLERYAPRQQSVTAVKTVPTQQPATYRAVGPDHDQALADLSSMFDLDAASKPWLTQALTHTSWSYERSAETKAARQRDNALLAHHGSFVINFLAAAARARDILSRTLSPDDEEARLLTPSNAEVRQLGEAMYLGNGYLMGRGASATGTAGAVESPAQAVVAVAWRIHGSRMVRRRPESLDRWLTTLDNSHDASTQLNQILSAYGISASDQFSETGSHYDRTFRCTLSLNDGNRTFSWHALTTASGKKASRFAAAQEVLDLLDASMSAESRKWRAAERGLLTFFLSAQLRALPRLSGRARVRSAARGDLGTALLTTGDVNAFVAWAHSVADLVGELPSSLHTSVADYYRAVLGDARTGPTSAMTRVELAARDERDTAALLAGAAARRAMEGPGEGTLRDVIGRWWRAQALTTPVQLNDELMAEEPRLLARQLGAVREVLNWCGEAASSIEGRIDVEFDTRADQAHLLITMPGVDVAATCNALSGVLTQTIPYFECIPDEERLLVRLSAAPEHTDGVVLARLGLEAYALA